MLSFNNLLLLLDNYFSTVTTLLPSKIVHCFYATYGYNCPFFLFLKLVRIRAVGVKSATLPNTGCCRNIKIFLFDPGQR